MLLFTLIFLARVGAATDFERLRFFYDVGCEPELNAPAGLRTAAGAVATTDATDEEVRLGERILRRRIHEVPTGRHAFAAFIYDLSEHRGDDLVEALFFEYLRRPGNEALMRDFVEEITQIVKTNVVYADVPDEVAAERIALLIALVREDPARQGPVYDKAMIEFFTGQVVDADQILKAIESHRQVPQFKGDAVELAAEMKRDVKLSVSDLRLGGGRGFVITDLPHLVAGLRLDCWVREEAGLSVPPRLAEIALRVGLVGQSLTHH